MNAFGLLDAIGGYYLIRVAPEQAERVINAVYRRGIPHGSFRRGSDGALTFTVRRKEMRELRDIIDKSGFVGYIIYSKGLPFVIRRYRRRIGFFIGAALFMALAYVSTLFIWRVEVVSDTALNKNAVEQNLAQIGIKPGTFIPDVDFWALSGEYLTRFDDCSFISVNMSGTVAEVELRERVHTPQEDGDAPCNVVAAEGGVIDSFVINSGRGYVAPGMTVKPGDLLVSGVIDDIQGDCRLTGADAEIYAEVGRSVSVSVPLTYTEREYTGAERTEKRFVFFGVEIPLPFGDSDPGDGWEREEDCGSAVLPSGKPLPAAVKTVVWREYRDAERTRTPAEAEMIAAAELYRAIASEAEEARVLGVTKEIAGDEYGVTATARIRCIRNIAKKQNIITEIKTGE